MPATRKGKATRRHIFTIAAAAALALPTGAGAMLSHSPVGSPELMHHWDLDAPFQRFDPVGEGERLSTALVDRRGLTDLVLEGNNPFNGWASCSIVGPTALTPNDPYCYGYYDFSAGRSAKGDYLVDRASAASGLATGAPPGTAVTLETDASVSLWVRTSMTDAGATTQPADRFWDAPALITWASPNLKWGVHIRSIAGVGTVISTGWDRTGAGRLRVDGSTAIGDDAWHHVLVTYRRGPASNSYTVSIYIDGALDAGGTLNSFPLGFFPPDPASPIEVAMGTASPAGQDFVGELDEVQAFAGAFTPAQATALFESSEPARRQLVYPPMFYPRAHYGFEAPDPRGFFDQSGANRTAGFVGDQIVANVAGYEPPAYPGSVRRNSYARAPHSTDGCAESHAYLPHSFTVTLWLNIAGASSTAIPVIGSADGDWGLSIVGGAPRFHVRADSIEWPEDVFGDGQWHHVAIERSNHHFGTEPRTRLRMMVDGSSRLSPNDPEQVLMSSDVEGFSSAPISIGCGAVDVVRHLDEIRLYAQPPSPCEIRRIMQIEAADRAEPWSCLPR